MVRFFIVEVVQVLFLDERGGTRGKIVAVTCLTFTFAKECVTTRSTVGRGDGSK